MSDSESEDSANGQDMAEEFVSTFYDPEDSEDQESVGEAETEDLIDLYDHSRPLTPSSTIDEEGSDEVVSDSEPDEAHETNYLSAEKRARLSNSTIKAGTLITVTGEKDTPTELERSSQTSQDQEGWSEANIQEEFNRE